MSEKQEELPGIKDLSKKPTKPKPIEKSLFDKTVSMAKALSFGTKISAEQVLKRLEICKTCEFVEINDKGRMNCSICGCNLGSNNKTLRNLAAYEETPGKRGYGCFYHAEESLDLPDRSKWAREGL